MQRPDIPSLTGLRFVAAALVLWAHTVTGFFMPAQVPVLGTMPASGFLGMTLFFVLSGFVIHYNYGSSVGTFNASTIYSFVVARFARLYPLFFLCVVITMAVPRDPSPALGASWLSFLTMTHDWTPTVVFNGLLGDVFAPGAWSISAEVLLYIVYIPLAPLLARCLTSERVILWALGVLVALVSLFYLGRVIGWWLPTTEYTYLGLDFWLYHRSPFCRLSEFTLGALIAALYNVRSTSPVTMRERTVSAIAAGIGVVWALALLLSGAVPGLGKQVMTLQLSWGFAPSVAAVIYYLARCKSPVSRLVENRAMIALGDASYSIYLLQWLTFSTFMAQGVAANALLVPKILLAWLMTALLSLGCYYYFERPARSCIRRLLAIERLRGLLPGKRAAVPLVSDSPEPSNVRP
jgi:peptidoglycan/LPS O-acetylase OafA/YrhL